MALEQAILEAVRVLPAEKQQEVLNHAAKLRDEVKFGSLDQLKSQINQDIIEAKKKF